MGLGGFASKPPLGDAATQTRESLGVLLCRVAFASITDSY